jgi:hypothetical protein
MHPHNPAMKVNDLVKYARPQNEEEGQFRFRVLEIHRDVENRRAHITANLRLAYQAGGGCGLNRHRASSALAER